MHFMCRNSKGGENSQKNWILFCNNTLTVNTVCDSLLTASIGM